MKPLATAAFLASISLPLISFGGTLKYNLNAVYTGGTPSGSAPWVTFLFDDKNSNDYVDLTIQAHLDPSSTNFITDTNFNISPLPLDLTATIDPTKTVGSFTNPTISFGLNQFHAQASEWFDAQVAFATPNSGRFDGTDSVTIRLDSATTALNLSMFTALSTNSQGQPSSSPQYVSAHVQGLNTNPDSGSITSGPPVLVPLPPALWAGVALLGTMGLMRWRDAAVSHA